MLSRSTTIKRTWRWIGRVFLRGGDDEEEESNAPMGSHAEIQEKAPAGGVCTE